MENDQLRELYIEQPEQVRDLYNVELQASAKVACDIADWLLEGEAFSPDAVKMSSHHGDHGDRIVKCRHFSYEDDNITTSMEIDYECNSRFNVEVYDITISTVAEFNNSFTYLPATTYQLARAGNTICDASIMTYDHAAHNSGVPMSLAHIHELFDEFISIKNAAKGRY